MSSDLYHDAYLLQKEIKAFEEKLKEMKAAHKEMVDNITRNHAMSCDYELVPEKTPARSADAHWFYENEPELFNKYAHLSHSDSVAAMSKICGGYQALQSRIREFNEEEFVNSATMSLSEMKSDIGESAIKEYQEAGGVVTAKITGYKVVLLPAYKSAMLRAAQQEKASSE